MDGFLWQAIKTLISYEKAIKSDYTSTKLGTKSLKKCYRTQLKDPYSQVRSCCLQLLQNSFQNPFKNIDDDLFNNLSKDCIVLYFSSCTIAYAKCELRGDLGKPETDREIETRRGEGVIAERTKPTKAARFSISFFSCMHSNSTHR